MTSSTKAQTNGVLPVSASQTSSNNQKSATSKPSNPKLKVLVRRLPPGLTEAEFVSILGAEWKLGGGKVDWFLYKSGKDSKDPSKPSRPGRAYLHLTNESHILPLSDAVRQAIFEDALNTAANPCLVGPPNVEFAPFGRVPGGRRRVDARAGTIDQDPNFMAFLEGLANPVSAKDINAEGSTKDTASGKPDKVTTTPLVQYLKDKKASKKDSLNKGGKKQEPSNAKGKGNKESSSSPEESRKKGKDVKVDRAVERAAKEAVRILNREASNKSSTASAGASKSSSSTAAQSAPPKLDLAKVSGRQRGPAIAAHIKMLQRDLGLTPAQAHRQVRRDAADASKAEKATAAEKETAKQVVPTVSTPANVPTAPKASTPTQPTARGPRNRGQSARNDTSKQITPAAPIVLLKKNDGPSVVTPTTTSSAKPAPPANTRRGPTAVVPSEGATQAFVKHANPSQGVTEILLKEALEKFGAVSFVEIDKRKGFAYVDFADTDGLKKAIAANPISVAQGTVHVAQRKGAAPAQAAAPPQATEKKAAPQVPAAPSNRGGRGGHGRGGTIGRRGGRGGRGGAAAPGTAPSIPTGPSGK